MIYNTGAEAAHRGLWWGCWAVSTFFILSGFLTIYNLKLNTKLWEFTKTRMARLYPAYWVCLIITTVIVNLFMERFKVSFFSLLFNVTMLQGFVGIQNVDGAYWTITYEILFYMAIGFTLFIKKLIKLKNIYEKMSFVWIVFVVAYRVILLPLGINSHMITILTNHTHLFIIGVSLFYINSNKRNYLSYINLALSIFVHLHKTNLEYTIFVVLIIVLIVLFIRTEWKLKYDRVLNWLTEISFPLYLIHQFMGYTIIYYFDILFEMRVLGIVVAFAASLLVADLVHRFVEKPVISLSKNWAQK